MSFVPIATPPPTPPSPRTRELAALFSKVLEEYRKSHPSVTGAEIRSAMRMALRGSGGGPSALPAGLAVGLGVMVLFLGMGLLFLREGSGGGEVAPVVPMVVVALGIFLALVLVLFRTLSR